VGIGNRIRKKVTKQDLEKNIGGDNADKEGRHPFNGVDETIHINAVHGKFPRGTSQIRAAAASAAAAFRLSMRDGAQYAALSFASCALSSFMIVSGSPPAFLTLSAQVFASGSDAFFHSATCAALGSQPPLPASGLFFSN